MKNQFYARLSGTTALLGAFGVIFGAFGAHFLKNRLEIEMLDIIRTGVQYLFFHVMALLFVILLGVRNESSRLLRGAGILFLSGILLFSGSLFWLATQSLMGMNLRFIGAITPLGGLCFIGAWCMIAMYAFSGLSKENI